MNQSDLDPERVNDRKVGFSLLEALTHPPVPVEVVEELLRHPYQWFRIEAAEWCGRQKDVRFLVHMASALNDRSEHVAQAAAAALAAMGGQEAREALRRAFVEDAVQQSHYLAQALAAFGEEGFKVLVRCCQNASPTVRHYAAKALGATGSDEARSILESMVTDMEKTQSGALVATGAREGLKTLSRVQGRAAQQAVQGPTSPPSAGPRP